MPTRIKEADEWPQKPSCVARRVGRGWRTPRQWLLPHPVPGVWPALALVVLCLVTTACSPVVAVRRSVQQPAQVPVRSFPNVWVAAEHMSLDMTVAEGLASHLGESGELAVRVIPFAELELMRVSGRIPPASVVLLIESEVQESTRPEWGSRPQTVCGRSGCYTQRSSYMYDVPVARAKVGLTVFDGPSAQPLQRMEIQVDAEGDNFLEVRDTLIRRIERRLVALVDSPTERVRVEFLKVGHGKVDAALQLIDDGAWAKGVQALEHFSQSKAVDELAPPARARFFYDLAQAYRYGDEVTLGDLDRATSLLERAQALSAEPRYEHALKQVEAQRTRIATLVAQAKARAHNLSVHSRGGTRAAGASEAAASVEPVPAPPPGYQSAETDVP